MRIETGILQYSRIVSNRFIYRVSGEISLVSTEGLRSMEVLPGRVVVSRHEPLLDHMVDSIIKAIPKLILFYSIGVVCSIKHILCHHAR